MEIDIAPTVFEEELLRLYEVALQQRRLEVAEHLLSALEALAHSDALSCSVRNRAYLSIVP